MGDTSIQWTDKTWNPVRGCSLVSAGCQNCYAMKMAHRFSGKGQPYEGLTEMSKHGPRWNGTARFVPEMLDVPLRAKKPATWFVNSMSDLFHSDISFEQIAAVFGVMASCQSQTFQVLTKRPERAAEFFAWANDQAPAGKPLQTCLMAVLDYEREHHRMSDEGPLHTKRCADPDGPWPLPNLWLGVSIEDQEAADKRIPILLTLPAAVRFVSAEPLLGSVDLLTAAFNGADSFGSMAGIDWVIVGGESGHGARVCNVSDIRSVVEQCKRASVPCFVKQLGSNTHDEMAGGDALPHPSDRKGGDIAEFPADLRVREFPRGHEVAR